MAARLACLFLGLLSGAMAAIAVALVPFWTALPPAEFRTWFAVHAPRIGALMFPLGGGAALFATAALVLGWGGPARVWLGLAAAGVLGVAAVTMLVNEPANARFAAPGALTDAETVALLARWRWWHGVRLALGLAGFYASLRALSSLT